MDEELKPCPFCGGGVRVTVNGRARHPWEVACMNRECEVQAIAYSVSDWNTRPIEDALRAELAELRAFKASVPWKKMWLAMEVSDYAIGRYDDSMWSGVDLRDAIDWLAANAPEEDEE